MATLAQPAPFNTAPACPSQPLPRATADSWAGATEEQERALYRATFKLFQTGGLGEALCGVLREKSHPHLLPYVGGNVPLNYYLKHNFKDRDTDR